MGYWKGLESHSQFARDGRKLPVIIPWDETIEEPASRELQSFVLILHLSCGILFHRRVFEVHGRGSPLELRLGLRRRVPHLDRLDLTR